MLQSVCLTILSEEGGQCSTDMMVRMHGIESVSFSRKVIAEKEAYLLTDLLIDL